MFTQECQGAEVNVSFFALPHVFEEEVAAKRVPVLDVKTDTQKNNGKQKLLTNCFHISQY